MLLVEELLNAFKSGESADEFSFGVRLLSTPIAIFILLCTTTIYYGRVFNRFSDCNEPFKKVVKVMNGLGRTHNNGGMNDASNVWKKCEVKLEGFVDVDGGFFG